MLEPDPEVRLRTLMAALSEAGHPDIAHSAHLDNEGVVWIAIPHELELQLAIWRGFFLAGEEMFCWSCFLSPVGECEHEVEWR